MRILSDVSAVWLSGITSDAPLRSAPNRCSMRCPGRAASGGSLPDSVLQDSVSHALLRLEQKEQEPMGLTFSFQNTQELQISLEMSLRSYSVTAPPPRAECFWYSCFKPLQ